MKSTAYTLVMALLLGIGAFFLTRTACEKRSTRTFAEKVSSLEQNIPANLAWMRKELSLTDQEFARECEIHEAHMVEYRRLCAEMNASRERLKLALEGGKEFTDDGRSAILDYETHFEACERAVIQHVRKAAASMNPDAGRIYVKRMLPHLFPEHDLNLQASASTSRHP